MKLLVSVANADDARAAMEGGADIIDAKDPSAGALGAVRMEVLGRIRHALEGRRMMTAALGDASDGAAAAQLAEEFVRCGARFVKVGFAGVVEPSRVEEIAARAARACGAVESASGVVAVVYADALPEESVDATTLVSIAARAGARGVLVDTRTKSGPGLTSLWSAGRLSSWVTEAHEHGLFAAVAGKLELNDLEVVSDADADIAGVRGAACVGDRNGRVSAERVRGLVERCHSGRSSVRSDSMSSALTITEVTSGGSARVK